MATFTPKNFPADVQGNKSFSGIGERTIYAPVTADMSGYKYADGFKTSKPTNLLSINGYIMDTVQTGKKVYFTYPAKLYKDLGKSKGTFAAVSLKSAKSNPDGYIAIGHITKPAGKGQARIGAGASTQYAVAEEIEKLAALNKKKYEFVSTAKPGSTAPDLIVKYDSKKIQFEIKGTNSPLAPITFFDKSVNRRSAIPEIINDIALIFKPEGAIIRSGESAFLVAMDYYKTKDSTIGLAGDEGAPRSGKLPSDFTTTDTTKLQKLRKIIIDHFKEGGDDYFVVHNRTNDKFEIYSVDASNNPLDYPALPRFSSFSLATYGGASSGSTRVGLKIKLK
jgi:hypothetical protein